MAIAARPSATGDSLDGCSGSGCEPQSSLLAESRTFSTASRRSRSRARTRSRASTQVLGRVSAAMSTMMEAQPSPQVVIVAPATAIGEDRVPGPRAMMMPLRARATGSYALNVAPLPSARRPIHERLSQHAPVSPPPWSPFPRPRARLVVRNGRGDRPASPTPQRVLALLSLMALGEAREARVLHVLLPALLQPLG